MADEDNVSLLGEGIAPRWVMSDEHKAKMAAGRAAAKTRGRPNMREAAASLPRPAEVGGEPSIDELERRIAAVGDGGELTRQARGVTDASFDFPMKGRVPGWDYEWKTVRVNGQEVDPSDLTEIDAGGWIPVPASHFRSLVPPGWSRAYIERRGQRAYMRPMRLTLEAREEQKRHAMTQKSDRLMTAQAGDAGREFARRVNPDGTPAAQIDVDVRPLI